MKLYSSDKKNFWNNHTLNDFQQLAILENVQSYEISSLCFLKDGRIASSLDNNIFIYHKITFKIEISIKTSKNISYMNINKDGILITCLRGTYINLYEIKGKRYKNIQTIRPYNLIRDIIGIFDNSFSILKFIELKNGDIALLVWAYGICFYKRNKKYSYLNKFIENQNGSTTDLCELNNNQYCLSKTYTHTINFLDMNLKKITKTIKVNESSDSKNQLLLMNKTDLLLTGDNSITIIDINKKEIIKYIKLELKSGFLSSIYKISNKRILSGFWDNYIEQLEYDEKKKEFKVISGTIQKKSEGLELFNIYSISIFNNKFIVASSNNHIGCCSIIVYKSKKK